METNEIKAALDALNTTNETALKSLNDRLAKAEAEAKAARKSAEHVETVLNRPGMGGSIGDPNERAIAAEKKAIASFMRTSGAHSLHEHSAVAEIKDMSVISGPDGGYTALNTFSTVLNKTEDEASVIRTIASVVPISGPAFEEIVDDDHGMEAEWVAETQSRSTTTSPRVRKTMIPAHEIHAAPKATQTIIEDSAFDIAGWLVEKGGTRFGRKEETAFVNGNGVGQPRGYATYPTEATADGTRGWGTMEHVATGTNGSFGTGANGANKLIDLIATLRPGYRAGARFVMNRTTLAQVRKLKDDNGQFAFVQSIAPSAPSTLLGYPVSECEEMSAYSGTGNLPIAFGNFTRGYKIVDRVGVNVLRDPYTDKPNVIFDMRKRTGGDVADFQAIKFLKMSNS